MKSTIAFCGLIAGLLGPVAALQAQTCTVVMDQTGIGVINCWSPPTITIPPPATHFETPDEWHERMSRTELTPLEQWQTDSYVRMGGIDMHPNEMDLATGRLWELMHRPLPSFRGNEPIYSVDIPLR